MSVVRDLIDVDPITRDETNSVQEASIVEFEVKHRGLEHRPTMIGARDRVYKTTMIGS